MELIVRAKSCLRSTFPIVAVSVALLMAAPPAQADSALAAPLCSTLKKLLPEVRTFKPEGARAQLVMAVAELFDYDAVKLRQVQAEIDSATSSTCPKEREAMLGILKMETLSEAVS
jgi:hypothetical protein